MDNELKEAIDIGVMNASARSSLTYQGLSLPWEMLVSRYKNIESGHDEQIKMSPEIAAKKAEDEKKYLEQMSEIIIKKINEPKINHDIAAEQKMWELLNKDILEAMNAEIKAAEESIKVNAKQRRANLEEELSNEREEVSVLIQQLTEEKNSLETKMANLKFFSFVAKKETQEKIEQLSRKLQEAIEKSKQYSPEKMHICWIERKLRN